MRPSAAPVPRPPNTASAQDIESVGVSRTQRLVVWRKGLGLPDFFENQLRLGGPSLDFAYQPEASAVKWRQAKIVDRPSMIGGWIAAVMLPAVARIGVRIFDHHPVAGDLGNDRSSGDRTAFGVAVDDSFRRPLPARARIAVDQHPGRLEPERLDRASHGEHSRPVD